MKQYILTTPSRITDSQVRAIKRIVGDDGWNKEKNMSVNALRSLNSGWEKPKSMWTENRILQYLESSLSIPDGIVQIIKKYITLSELKKYLLTKTGWHHIGSNYDKVDFFMIEVRNLGLILKMVIDRAPDNEKAEIIKKYGTFFTKRAISIYKKDLLNKNEYSKLKNPFSDTEEASELNLLKSHINLLNNHDIKKMQFLENKFNLINNKKEDNIRAKEIKFADQLRKKGMELLNEKVSKVLMVCYLLYSLSDSCYSILHTY